MVYYEIWPAHSLIHTKQKGVGNFFYVNTFVAMASNTRHCPNVLIVELDKLILYSYFASMITFVHFKFQSNTMNKNNVLLLKNFNIDCSERTMKRKGQRID